MCGSVTLTRVRWRVGECVLRLIFHNIMLPNTLCLILLKHNNLQGKSDLLQNPCSICSSQQIRCSHHPEAPLIEDYRAGDMICSECGLVVGDR